MADGRTRFVCSKCKKITLLYVFHSSQLYESLPLHLLF
jgi:hypothetical protein